MIQTDIQQSNIETKPMTLFGKEYQVYTGSCCSSISAKRTLYVEFTELCNAHCPFCSAYHGRNTLSPITLKTCLDELVSSGAVDRVSITGGEPLIVGDFITLSRLFDTLEQSDLEYYALTTNGRYLAKNIVLLDSLKKLRYLNVSRHNQDDTHNCEIFGDRYIPDMDELAAMLKMMKRDGLDFRLNCTLQSDDATLDIPKYIKSAADHDIRNVLFRADYFGNVDGRLREKFSEVLQGRKESTKCRCMYGTVDGVSVEYREVDAELEQKLERDGGYIRNFVLHADGRLTGGWSYGSVQIANFGQKFSRTSAKTSAI